MVFDLTGKPGEEHQRKAKQTNMPKICYLPKKFSAERIQLIGKADKIMHDYAAQGYDLTLRQLYYQFVSRNIIPNRVEEYDKLGQLVSDARLAGLLDWDHLVDRTRNVLAVKHYDRPSQLLSESIDKYRWDKWDYNQTEYVEVWVEKNALMGIVSGICVELDVPHFACVGYTSQSEMWAAGQRLMRRMSKGKRVQIIHLGDHDPSGIDMTRDIIDRMTMFTHTPFNVHRIALNMDQIEQYQPPPNPAKVTDSRFASYREKYGNESWELDSLEPSVIVDTIREAVLQYRDEQRWEEAVQHEARGRLTLNMIVENFTDVVSFLRLRERRKAQSDPVLCATCGATVGNPFCHCSGQFLDNLKGIG
jgi:hypothetical protein